MWDLRTYNDGIHREEWEGLPMGRRCSDRRDSGGTGFKCCVMFV